ncbi:MAG TPA: sulfatase [Bacteroidales bacterium]|nr:sulfatase [Bacteroidales bacterium]
MNRIHPVFLLQFLFTMVLMVSCHSEGKKDKVSYPAQPNILLILADDLGIPQVGCYGNDYYQTDYIDALAEEGICFTEAYSAAAVCSPTRAALMTGKHPARLHLTDFIAGNGDTTTLLRQPDWQKHLPLEEETIAEILKGEGYRTAIFGKWHLSREKVPPGSLPYNPDKQGFDAHFVTYKPSESLPIGKWQQPDDDPHNADTITSLAIDFMKRSEKDPFFIIVSHNSIHDPLMESESRVERYRQKDGADRPENHPVMAAMVEHLDQSVGRILQYLEDTDKEQHTLVIFYSDNGAKHAYAEQKPFRKGKGWLYEGGIRVPLVMRWPGVIQPETVSSQVVSTPDLFATFLEVAGVERNPLTVDGKSILRVMVEPDTLLADQTAYWHYPHYHRGSGMVPGAAMREGKYKLVHWYEAGLTGQTGAWELYDLMEDPGEQHDLSEEMPEKLDSLRRQLEKWQGETGAQAPVLR